MTGTFLSVKSRKEDNEFYIPVEFKNNDIFVEHVI